jgi:hypothetical protein
MYSLQIDTNMRNFSCFNQPDLFLFQASVSGDRSSRKNRIYLVRFC